LILRIAVILSLLTSLGCQLKPSEHSEFYTWVDESGQLRTERVEQANSNDKTPSDGAVSADQNDVQPQSEVSSSSRAFDPADFTSSDEVDARLRDARLFAWQDESGKQNVTQMEKIETSQGDESLGQGMKMPLTAKRRFGATCCEKLASFERYLWGDLAGREIKFAEYFSYADGLSSDALMLDLADFERAGIRLKSFVKQGKMALPDVLLLNERFQLIDILATPFTHYVEESWASYGFMQGVVTEDQLRDAEYIVLIPSEQVGILELGEQAAKITNLGSVLVQRDAPAP